MAAKTWCLLICTFLLFCSYINCDEQEPAAETKSEDEFPVPEDDTPTEEENVVVLTDTNFDKYIKTQKIVLVEFYAPWCGHCKQLAPEYAKAAKTLKEYDPPVPLAKVDCTVQKELANRFNIQGYPTIMLFRNGEEADYEGPRDGDGIVSYMKEQADPNYVPPKDAVIVLTEDNFKGIVDQEDIMLVEFYAPWCGHCKKIEPHLKKAALVLQTGDAPILIGKVDATVEKELAKEHGITGYPTMKVFRKGEPSEYKGPREEPGISSYMREQSGDPTTLFADMNEVNKFLKSNLQEPVMLGVFESEEEDFYKLFLRANNDVRDEYKFGHTFAAEAKKFFGMKSSGVVVAHPEYLLIDGEPRYQIFDNKDGSPGDLQQFYKNHEVPRVGHMQQHTEKRFWKRPLVVVFYDVSFEPALRSMTQFWRQKIVPVAKQHPGIQFAVADETLFEQKVKDLGLEESGEDVNVGLYNDKGERFALKDEEFSTEALEEFIEQFNQGELKPVIKSKPVPKKVKPGKVQPVVGKSFTDVVLDEKKEVFIEFYAPWCGHCKKVAPVMEKLAKKLKKEANIVIGKMDATENEGPSNYPANGYPTIYYAVPGSKDKPVKFEGGSRELDDLMKFVQDNSKILQKKGEKHEL